MRNDDWLKIKCLRAHDFVIGEWMADADENVGAVLLGEFIDGDLRYVGQVGVAVRIAVNESGYPSVKSARKLAIKRSD